ncbi:hypothetical protein [Tropicimonas marinistellae]|uniref:hypothetical protein n=1 Tax=Tropicimonas marinistellae TaxID=1739787 RepID=UPI000831AF79|nr:hypothetical protein [Tropicimonas marinistellae]
MTLTAETVTAAAAALNRVETIDRIVVDISNRIGREERNIGEELISTLGRNMLRGPSADLIGRSALCGIVNGLIDEREAVAEKYAEVVEFPPAPPRVDPSRANRKAAT